MRIGGRVTPADIDRLAKIIESERAGENFEPFDVDEARRLILKSITERQPLLVGCAEAPNGEMPRLRAVCDQLGLTWCEYQDGTRNWSPSVTLSRPDLDEPLNWVSGMDPHIPHLSAGEIKTLTKQGRMTRELELMEFAVAFPCPLILAGTE
jgi:hypothetical protein